MSSKLRLQILVVDDEPSVRLAIKLLLKHDGHEVQAVDSGEQALAMLDQRKFDLVLTDFCMPGIRGDEMVARIRQRVPAQPIIMATAFAEEYKRAFPPSGDVDALLSKPFSLAELREAIDHALPRSDSAETTGLPLAVNTPPTQHLAPPPGP